MSVVERLEKQAFWIHVGKEWHKFDGSEVLPCGDRKVVLLDDVLPFAEQLDKLQKEFLASQHDRDIAEQTLEDCVSKNEELTKTNLELEERLEKMEKFLAKKMFQIRDLQTKEG